MINVQTIQIRFFFSIAAIVLLTLSLFTYHRVMSLVDTSETVNQSNKLKLGIEKVYSHLREAEAHNRGLMLTGDSVFYPPLEKAVQEVEETISQLENTVSNRQQENISTLKKLVTDRIGYLHTANNDSSVLSPDFYHGKVIMDKINVLITQMEEREDAVLDEKMSSLRQNFQLTPPVTLSLILFSLLLLVWGYYRITRELKKTRDLQQLVLEKNEALKERNDFIESLIDSSVDMLVVVDREQKILAVNNKASSFFGKTKNDMIGRALDEMNPGYAEMDISGELRKAFSGEVIYMPEFRPKYTDSTWEINVIPLRKDEVIYAVMITAHEVTDIIDNKNKLQQLNDELLYFNETAKHAEQMMMFGTFGADFKTKKLIYSENLYRLLGCEPFEFEPSRKKFLSFVHPDDVEYLVQASKDVYVDDYVRRWEFRMIRKDGKQIEIRASGKVFTNAKGENWLTGTLHDITEEKNQQRILLQTNQELKLSEERYQLMVGEMEDYAIVFLGTDGTIENWNKGVKRIYGFEEIELVGRNYSVFFTKNDKDKNIPGSVIAGAVREGKYSHEGWRIRQNGTVFWSSIVLTALKNEDETIVGFSMITRDLTERRIADEKMSKHAELLEQKNIDLENMNRELQSFAYISSHDLQEPLRKIQTFADRILENDYKLLSERGQDYFQRMQTAAKRMQKLIEDLLEYAQTNAGGKNFETVELETIVNDVRSEMKEIIEANGAVVELRTSVTLKVIIFQFRQLLQNLFSNAMKFAKPGIPPHITIDSKIDKGIHLNNSLNPDAHYFYITVRDKGIGFEQEYSKKIFELFQRLHGKHEYKGTGIGLAICKKIIENHHGMIAATGEPGEGAVFHIYIPADL